MTPQDQQSPASIQSTGGPEPVREQDKIMLVLAYLFPLSLIPMLTVKDSPQVNWHAKQGTVFGVAWIVLMTICAVIPFVNCIAVPVASLGGLVVTVMAIMKALGGNRWRIPVVADLSEKF